MSPSSGDTDLSGARGDHQLEEAVECARKRGNWKLRRPGKLNEY